MKELAPEEIFQKITEMSAVTFLKPVRSESQLCSEVDHINGLVVKLSDRVEELAYRIGCLEEEVVRIFKVLACTGCNLSRGDGGVRWDCPVHGAPQVRLKGD